jgi:hypothetical protein
MMLSRILFKGNDCKIYFFHKCSYFLIFSQISFNEI